MFADRQTDRQTDTVITVLRSSIRGGVIIISSVSPKNVLSSLDPGHLTTQNVIDEILISA